MKKLSILTLLLLWIMYSPAHAQELHPQFRNFTVKEGLPSLETYDVLQDSRGYIWIATDAGVARYDGYSFRNYTSKDGLSDNTIFGLFEDHRGRIWFRTFNGGISYFYNDSIYRLPCNEKLKALRKEGIILSLYVDDHDTVWLGAVMNHSPLRIIPPYYDSVLVHSASDGYANYISIINGHAICGANYIHGKARSLKLPVLSGATFQKELPFNYGKQIGKWQHIKVTTRHNGTIIYIAGTVLLEIFPNDSMAVHDYKVRTTSAYEDNENNLWVGLSRGGVLFYKDGDMSKSPLHFLSNNTITSVRQDNENNYWFTSLEEGVFLIPNLNFLTYKLPGISLHNKPTRVLPDGDNLWISVGDTGIALVKPGSPISFFLKGEKNLGLVQSLIKLKTGEVVGGGSEGILYVKNNKAFQKNPDSYPRVIYPSADGGFWKATHERLLKAEGNEFRLHTFLSFRPDALYEDSLGTLWLGGIDGLWTYRNGVLKSLKHIHPLLNNRIVDIKMRGDHVWLATKGNGIILMRPDTVINLTSLHGLASDICRSLCFDKTGAVWLGTNKGISRIEIRDGYRFRISNYNTFNGLVSDDVRQVASSGKHIYIATTSGVTMFNLEKLALNTSPPPVYLTRIEVNGRPRPAGSNLVLSHNENYINFFFTGLSYKIPGSIRYLYQLEGVDSTWKVTASTYVQYTTLPPGKYTFKVYAVNHDGTRSAAPAAFSIEISKPFWARWWFITLCVLLALVIIVLVVILRERNIRRREMEKMELNQKMSDLELKSIRAQMNPHFIFNALNSIQRFILENDSLSAQKYLTKFARLVRSVLSNSRTEMIPLSKELETLKIYIEIEALRFGDQFSYSFTVNDKLDKDNLLVPSMFVQPYIENAIWHGLMHKQDDRLLRVRVYEQNEKLVIEVEDNGVGRAQSQQFNLQNQKEHESMGTTLNQERITILNQVHKTDIKAIFSDLMDDKGNAKGTCVRIEFPIIHAY